MAYDLFISYARVSSAEPARALADLVAGAGRSVFLDTSAIPPGAPFPDELAAAVHDARSVVVFADGEYFAREWCLREFKAAIGGDRRRLVVALPAGAIPAAVLLSLPPETARRSWPVARDTAALAALVGRVLDGDTGRALELPGQSPLLPDGMVRPTDSRPGQPCSIDGAPDSLGDAFVGREEEVWRVFDALETSRLAGPPRAVLVSGGAGSGKTQLAAEFLRRVGPRYHDAVFWIRADAAPDERAANWRHVLAALGIDAPAGTDLVALQGAAAARWVALARDGKRVLVVVDNIPEPSAGQPALPLATWCPARQHVSVLATSRRHQLHDADEVIVLPSLAPAAGVALLSRPPVDRRWLEPDQWTAVVRWVGGLPLALQILHAGLADGALSAPALLERSGRDEPAPALDDDLRALEEALPAGALRGVAAAFSASLAALQSDPPAFAGLAVLSLLPPWPLEDPLARLFAGDKEVAMLARRGWLQPASGPQGSRQWRLHRVAASFVRSQSDAVEALAGLLQALDAALAADAAVMGDASGRLGWILGALTDRVRALAQAQAADPRLVDLAEDVALKASFHRLADARVRGLRNAGAGWAAVLVAWDRVLAEAGKVVEKNNAAELAQLPHALQSLGRIPQISALIAGLLRHPDATVRAATKNHATRYRPEVMIPALLAATAAETDPTQRALAAEHFQRWIQAGGEQLAPLLAWVERGLAEPAPREPLVMSLAGEIIHFHSDDAPEAAAHLRLALERVAGLSAGEVAPDIAIAAAQALGQHHAATSFEALATALERAGSQGDAPDRLRAIEVLGAYLAEIDRPSRPIVDHVEINDDGQLVLKGRAPPKTPLPELSRPLVSIVTGGAGLAAARALDALLAYTAGREALMDAIGPLFEANDTRRIEWLCGSWIAHDASREAPYRDAEPHWWRGMLREERGDVDGALEDFGDVVALAPGFGHAHKAIARLEARHGDPVRAAAALENARKLMPDDPALEQIRAMLKAPPTS